MSQLLNSIEKWEQAWSDYVSALSHYDSDGAPIANRQLSLILYLNGGDDGTFDGGVLQFTRHNRIIIPQAGVGAVFPSAYPYLHASTPVTRGIKYAVVTWYR